MPLYDYRCSKCKHEFEIIRPAHLTTRPLCPECKGSADKMPVGTKSYSIKGDNSASVTPKKHRQ